MSNTRYIEFDSTHRNRNEWPSPAEFEIPISQSGRKGQQDALDPVSQAATAFSWKGNNFNVGIVSTFITLTLAGAPIVNSSGNFTIVVTGSGVLGSNNLATAPGYYIGAILVDALATQQSRIIDYLYLGNNRANITTLTAFTLPLPAAFTITDPTDFTPTWNPLLYVPGPFPGDNLFVNTIVYNETRNQSRPSGVFNATTSILPLITTGSTLSTPTSGPITVWAITDVFSIRTTKPLIWTQLNGDPINNPPTFTSFNLLIANATLSAQTMVGGFLEKMAYRTSPINALVAVASTSVMTLSGNDGGLNLLGGAVVGNNNFYVGYTIRMITGAAAQQIVTIVAYNAVTNQITVFPGFTPAPAALDTYILEFNGQAQKIVKYVDFRATALPGSTVTQVNFPAIDNNGINASDVNGYYNNLYIVRGGGEVRTITDYQVTRVGNTITSRIATVNTAFGGIPGPFTITSGIVNPGFTSIISQFATPAHDLLGGQLNYGFLPFSYDNLYPFVYTGSQVSQQEMSCYQIQLISIVLPNLTLDTNYGSLISFHPYVYVELQNVSAAGSGHNNIIYSNNPNANKMLFRCVIGNVPAPGSQRFIALNSDGMVQTIKFKPNDNLRFSVHMPSGDLFKTIIPETFGPFIPNPFIQISACFSIKRV